MFKNNNKKIWKFGSVFLGLFLCFLLFGKTPVKAVDNRILDVWRFDDINQLSSSINENNDFVLNSPWARDTNDPPATGNGRIYASAANYAVAQVPDYDVSSSGFSLNLLRLWNENIGGTGDGDGEIGLQGSDAVGGVVFDVNLKSNGFYWYTGGASGGCSGTTDNFSTYETILTNNSWNMLTINIKATSSQIYINGNNLLAECVYVNTVDLTKKPDQINLVGGSGSTYMISDFAVFDSLLSGDEIDSIYANWHTDGKSVYEWVYNQTMPPSYYQSDTGIFYFSSPYICTKGSTCKIDYAYSELILTEYDYIEINNFNIITATSSFIATSSIIDNTGFFPDKRNGLSWFNVSDNSSTTAIYYSGYYWYQVSAHLSAYWDSNLGQMVPATTTIPYVFSINWLSQEDINDIISGITGKLTSTSSSGFLDTHALACSDEEWSSTSSIPILGINLDRLGCNTKKWILDMGIKPIEYIKSKILNICSKLMNMFPLSLFKNINNSWKIETSSITAFLRPKQALASSFATSTGIYDNTGNDGFNLSIQGFLGTTGTTTISLLSRQGIIDAIGEDNFNIYYYSCRGLVWVLFLVYCWNIITERTHKEIL